MDNRPPVRNTARRNRHRKLLSRGAPPCHLCGGEINYTAGHLDPLSFTADHIIPIARGGPDTLENLAAAHRRCNLQKNAGPPPRQENPGVTFVTERNW